MTKDPYEALRYKEFNLFLFLRFALVFAWTMQFVVIEWQVYSLTKDPLALGIIGLMEIIPAISFALFAGHIVDQKEKRKLLMLCISGFMLFSMFSLLIPKKAYANAATWSSSVWQIASVMGPALAGFAIVWFGVHGSMFIIFGFAALSMLFLYFIKPKPILNPKIGEPIFQSLKQGLKFVFNTKVILGAITLDMVAVLFGGAIALLPIFAQDILHVGSQGFGILRASPAIGSFITLIAVAYFPLNKNAGLKLLGAIAGFGLCIILFGLSSWFWLSVVALFFSGVFDGVSVVIRQTILQLKTPDNMRGRVSSVNSIFVGSSNELGAFESGVAAKLMGTVASVVFGGSMTLLVVLFTSIKFPKLRKLDLEKDLVEMDN